MIIFGKYEIMRAPGWKEDIKSLNDVNFMVDMLESCLVCKKDHVIYDYKSLPSSTVCYPSSFQTRPQHPCCHQLTNYLKNPVYSYIAGPEPVKNMFFDYNLYFNNSNKHGENTQISS